MNDGSLVALYAKMTFDDNALFRHKDMAVLRDADEEEPAETRAAAAGLSYVKLNGTIGCLVNGAGLAITCCLGYSRPPRDSSASPD